MYFTVRSKEYVIKFYYFNINIFWYIPLFHLQGPNLVFILIDDVGWADFGYSNRISSIVGENNVSDGQIPTPNIDRLAHSGLKLTSHYVHPTCTPSRYILAK